MANQFDRAQPIGQEAAAQEDSGIHERPTVRIPETARLAPEQYATYQESVEESVGRFVPDAADFFRQAALLKRLEESKNPYDEDLRHEAEATLVSGFDAQKFVEEHKGNSQESIEALTKLMELPDDVSGKLTRQVENAALARRDLEPTLRAKTPISLLPETMRHAQSEDFLAQEKEASRIEKQIGRLSSEGQGVWTAENQDQEKSEVIDEEKLLARSNETLLDLEGFVERIRGTLAKAENAEEATAIQAILTNAEREAEALRKMKDDYQKEFTQDRLIKTRRPVLGEAKKATESTTALEKKMQTIDDFMFVNESLVKESQTKSAAKKQEKSAEDFFDLSM